MARVRSPLLRTSSAARGVGLALTHGATQRIAAKRTSNVRLSIAISGMYSQQQRHRMQAFALRYRLGTLVVLDLSNSIVVELQKSFALAE